MYSMFEICCTKCKSRIGYSEREDMNNIICCECYWNDIMQEIEDEKHREFITKERNEFEKGNRDSKKPSKGRLW